MIGRSAGFLLGCALVLMSYSFASAQIRLPTPGGNQPPPAAGPAPAPAAGGMIDAVSADMNLVLQQVKKAPGYQNAEIVTGQNNYRVVRAQVNGVTVLVAPEVCKDGSCKALRYVSFLGKQGVDAKWINAWNAQKLWGRAAIDNEGDFQFDMTIHLWGGASPQYIAETADLFGAALKWLFEFKP
jgi:Putative bacterial sensory transduction regulator